MTQTNAEIADLVAKPVARPVARYLGTSLLLLGVVACGGGSVGGFHSTPTGTGGTGGNSPTSSGGSVGTGGFGGETFPGKSVGPQPNFGPTVVSAPQTPRPLSGGTLRLSKSGTRVFVSDPDRDLVNVVDLSLVGTSTVHSFTFSPGDEPGRLVEGDGGKVHVVLRGGGAVATLDPADGSISRKNVCASPRGLAFDAPTSKLFVACEDGTLATVAADGTATAVSLERDLRDVVVVGDKVLISKLRSSELIACDKTGKRLGRTQAPSVVGKGLRDSSPFEGTIAWRTDATPDGHVVMVHERGSTGLVDTAKPGGYGGVDCTSNIVHTAITSFDPATMAPVTTTMPFGRAVLPVDFAYVSDSDQYAVVAAGNAHTPGLPTLFLVSAKENVPVNGNSASPVILEIFGSGSPIAFDGTGGSSVGGSSTGGSATGGSSTGGSSVGGSSMGGTAGAASGGTAGGSGGATGPSGGSPVPSPLRPMNGCLDNGASSIPASGEPVAVVYSAKLQVIIVQSRQPSELQIFQTSGLLLATVDLPGGDMTDTGHAIFHSNAGGSIACASCHAEGAEDGHVWNFAETGPRRTQSLRGGVKGTEPFHWDGDMKDLDMIMDKVFVGRMSGPVLGNEQKGALSGFVNAIPTVAAPAVVDASSVQRGKALFEDAQKTGCATCHGGPRFTNNTTVAVGTGGAFQVPSLIGVGWRTPLMHNGCAATLADRFDPACGGATHGNVTSLTAQDKSDLVSYLETL